MKELKLGTKYKAFGTVFIVTEIFNVDFSSCSRKYYLQEVNGTRWFYADYEMLLNETITEL